MGNSFEAKNNTMFSPTETHVVPLAEAAKLTKNYRRIFGSVFLGGAFKKDAIIDLLSDPRCVGLKIYMARKDDDLCTPTFVLCGVDALGCDILTKTLDRSTICPPDCGTLNVLNSDGIPHP